MKREAQGLGSSSMAVDGGAVTWGGGTSTGNMISSTESCQRSRGGMGARVNEQAAVGRMCLPRQWGQFCAALPSMSNLLGCGGTWGTHRGSRLDQELPWWPVLSG